MAGLAQGCSLQESRAPLCPPAAPAPGWQSQWSSPQGPAPPHPTLCRQRWCSVSLLPAGPLWPPVLPSSSHFTLWGLHAGSWNPLGALPMARPALLPSQAPAPTHLPLT